MSQILNKNYEYSCYLTKKYKKAVSFHGDMLENIVDKKNIYNFLNLKNYKILTNDFFNINGSQNYVELMDDRHQKDFYYYYDEEDKLRYNHELNINKLVTNNFKEELFNLLFSKKTFEKKYTLKESYSVSFTLKKNEEDEIYDVFVTTPFSWNGFLLEHRFGTRRHIQIVNNQKINRNKLNKIEEEIKNEIENMTFEKSPCHDCAFRHLYTLSGKCFQSYSKEKR